MKKIAVALSLVLALAGFAAAGTHVYTNYFGQLVTVDTVTGIGTVTIPAGTAATPAYGPSYAQGVVDAQAVTVIPDTINVLTSSGKATGLTNTITIANLPASAVGKTIWVANATGSTNAVALAKTGNYYGPAIALAAGQGTFVLVTATNVLLGR